MNIIFTIICSIVVAFFFLGAVFDLWKKLWNAIEGQVVAVNMTKRYVPNEGAKRAVKIRYRYVAKNREYIGEETKPFEVRYYEEDDAIRSLNAQFPVGGKIVVYHPRSTPSVSSITPGGAAFPKLLMGLIVTIAYLLYYFLMFTEMSR